MLEEKTPFTKYPKSRSQMNLNSKNGNGRVMVTEKRYRLRNVGRDDGMSIGWIHYETKNVVIYVNGYRENLYDHD